MARMTKLETERLKKTGYELFIRGMKIDDIAEHLGKNRKTIYKWANDDEWKNSEKNKVSARVVAMKLKEKLVAMLDTELEKDDINIASISDSTAKIIKSLDRLLPETDTRADVLVFIEYLVEYANKTPDKVFSSKLIEHIDPLSEHIKQKEYRVN